jgi:hypothetical protein
MHMRTRVRIPLHDHSVTCVCFMWWVCARGCPQAVLAAQQALEAIVREEQEASQRLQAALTSGTRAPRSDHPRDRDVDHPRDRDIDRTRERDRDRAAPAPFSARGDGGHRGPDSGDRREGGQAGCVGCGGSVCVCVCVGGVGGGNMGLRTAAPVAGEGPVRAVLLVWTFYGGVT